MSQQCVFVRGWPGFVSVRNRRSSFRADGPLVLLMVAVTWLWTCAPAVRAGSLHEQWEAALAEEFGIYRDALRRALEDGSVVQLLPSTADREVAVAGLTWVKAPLGRFLDGQREVAEHHGSKSTLAAGLVGPFPRLRDFHRVQLDGSDIEELSRCRPGNCAVKMFARDLHALTSMSAADRADTERMNHFFRQAFHKLLQDYRASGNHALVSYGDKEDRVVGRVEFEMLLASSPYLREVAPGLLRHLRDYPGSSEPGVEDIFYWSKVEFGLRPTIRLNHMTVYRNSHHPRVPWVIASKQLYATHYFQSALELRFVILPPGEDGRNGFYLLSVNRCRSDGLEGFWAGIVRRMVRNKTKDGMYRYLHFTRQQAEQPLEAYNAHPADAQ